MNQLYLDIENLFKQLQHFESRNDETFAKKSFDVLNNLKPSYEINDKDIIDIALNIRELPKQYYAERAFGDFNITLFQGNNFSIQIYLMNNIDTEIHDHGFVGAYKLLKGANIQNNFQFIKDRNIDNDIILGELKSLGKQKYQKNDTALLEKGLIHQITRLSDDNITLMVMRNYINENYVYVYPNLQIANTPPSNLLNRKLYALAYLFDKKIDYREKAQELIESINLQELSTTYLRIQNYPFGLEFKMIFKEMIYNHLEELKLNQYFDEHNKYIQKQEILSQMK